MKCIYNKPLSDEQLLAFLDGEADSDTINHLRECPYCQGQLRAMETFEQRLVRATHPNRHTLLDFSFGLTSEATIESLRPHVERCKRCQKILAEFESYKEESYQPVIQSAPSSRPAIRRLRPGELLHELVAYLLPQQVAAMPVLGNGERSLVAEAGDVKLFLNIGPEGQGFTISGQVVAEAEKQEVWEGALATLAPLNSQGNSYSALLNDLGEFTCQYVRPDTYKLRIESLAGIALILYDVSLA